MTFEIIDLASATSDCLERAAALLVAGFKEHWPNACPDLDSARAEVNECLATADRVGRVAVDASGRARGWVGARPGYHGKTWELHPVVVDPAQQGQGIGRVLVGDAEGQVRRRGGLTMWLGSDDEGGRTTLAGVDLYPDPLEKLSIMQNVQVHPFEFYLKLGYVVVSVIPDANGFGKPDILMAKRLD